MTGGSRRRHARAVVDQRHLTENLAGSDGRQHVNAAVCQPDDLDVALHDDEGFIADLVFAEDLAAFAEIFTAAALNRHRGLVTGSIDTYR